MWPVITKALLKAKKAAKRRLFEKIFDYNFPMPKRQEKAAKKGLFLVGDS
jgi:hypothetical protein